MAADPFEAELVALGLSRQWEKDDEEYYRLSTAWWQSFSVFKVDDNDWVVCQYDHDAGVDSEGQLYTSYEDWDEHFPSWIEAARAIEERYLRA